MLGVLSPFVLLVAAAIGLYGCGGGSGSCGCNTSLSLATPGWAGPYSGTWVLGPGGTSAASASGQTWTANVDATNKITVSIVIPAGSLVPTQTVTATGLLFRDGTFSASGTVTITSTPLLTEPLTISGTWGAEDGIETIDGAFQVGVSMATGTLTGVLQPTTPVHGVSVPGAYVGTAADGGVLVTVASGGILTVAMPLNIGNTSHQTGQVMSDGTITGSGTVDGTSTTVTSTGTWKIVGGVIQCSGTWDTSAPLVGGVTHGTWSFNLPPHS
jgi:hypothetical protein